MTQEQLIDQFCEFRGKCTTDDVVALNFAYEMLAPRWISVEKALPPIGCSMIVLVPYGGDVQLGEWDDGLFHEIKLGAIIHPTHWMPMPAPPHHIIDANKKVDRVIGFAEHIQTALDVMKKGGEE